MTDLYELIYRHGEFTFNYQTCDIKEIREFINSKGSIVPIAVYMLEPFLMVIATEEDLAKDLFRQPIAS